MKKIVAMMLALMLVLVSVSAMARGNTSSFPVTYPLEVTDALVLPITKGYTINDENNTTDNHPADVISFALGDSSKQQKVPAYYFNGVQDTSITPPTPVFAVDGQATVEGNNPIIEGTEKPRVTVTFAANAFKDLPVGEYVYYLYEANNKTAGVTYTYETNPLILKVTLVNEFKDDGSFDRIVIGGVALRLDNENLKNANTSKDKLNNADGDKDDVHNDYSKGKLTVTKKVTGNMGDTTKEWIFKVDFETTNSEIVRGTINMSGTNKGKYYGEPTGSGESATAPVTADDKGHITGTEKTGDAANAIAPGTNGWSKKTVYITLKHGQDFVFDNIPKGVIYTVTEIEAGLYGYNTTPTTAPTDTMTAGGTPSADFVNNYQQTPDTGIGLDSVPYLMIMAIALMGVAMMIVRRREEM